MQGCRDAWMRVCRYAEMPACRYVGRQVGSWQVCR